MRLEHLYRLRFTYPEGWVVDLEGGWQQFFFLAEGTCEGSVTGRFRAANTPLRRTEAGPFVPDMRGVIETGDGATIMFESHGYGRPYPAEARQIVASVLHLSGHPEYARLNDVVCVCTGEVRAGRGPAGSSELVVDVAELVWEPIGD